MPITKMTVLLILTICVTALLVSSPPSPAQEKIEGTVVKTNLTSCSPVPGKVGTCEGTLVLEVKKDGKANQITVKVTRDTILKKGDEKLFLFQLQGAPVTLTFAPDKGEKLAQSVTIKSR